MSAETGLMFFHPPQQKRRHEETGRTGFIVHQTEVSNIPSSGPLLTNYKNSPLPHSTERLRLQKEAQRRQGWCVGFRERWKLKVVLGISQQAGTAGCSTSAALLSHPSSSSLWSPSGPVPRVCANLSMLLSGSREIIIPPQVGLQMQTRQL